MPSSRTYIHYDPERTDYSVTAQELQTLIKEGQSLWKDVCLVSVSLGIPTLLNAVAETTRQTSFSLTLSMFLNYLFGILGLALGLIFGVAWFRSRQRLHSVVDSIKQKPKMAIIPEVVRGGQLPAAYLVEPASSQSSNTDKGIEDE
jgi:uncharacterized membrane protein YciS (DUF1049 family)